jgi:hypothetical protein
MKKLLALILVAGMATFIACGPSQKDKDEAAKKKQDSIHKADSIAAVEKEKHLADSLAAAEKEKRAKDSLAKLQNKPQGNYNPKPQQQQQQVAPTKPKGKG